MSKDNLDLNANYTNKYGFHVDNSAYVYKAQKGINEDVVKNISKMKQEPSWMTEFRLKSYRLFLQKEMPTWGGNLADINFENIYYYLKPTDKEQKRWEDVPKEMKETFDRLGIPEAEKKHLAGVKAQFESEVIYGSLLAELEEQGVIFLGTDDALKKYPHFFEEYFGKIIPPHDNKFAALNSAVWSGGSFVYIPKGVHVKRPLQAYFRINAMNMGQFERTLIIADEGSFAHYVEGCFTKGHKVTVKEGYKNIEDIKVGDIVLTSKGRYKKVYKTQKRQHRGYMYNIKVYGLSDEEFNVTPVHPFLVTKRSQKNERNKSYETEWVEAQDLKEKDYLVVPLISHSNAQETNRTFSITYRGVKEDLSVKLCPEFFRLIGYYLAEGSIEERGYLKFSFNINEMEFVNDIKNIIEKLFKHTKFHEFKYKDRKGIELVISSAKIARIFKEFGTLANKKSIPVWVMESSEENKKNLIIGYFRGDGNYYNKKNKHGLKEIFRMNTVSLYLALGMRDILLSLGIVAFLNKRLRGKDNRQDMYTIGVSGEFLIDFGKLVGIEVQNSLNNKKRATKFFIDTNYAYLPIKSISKHLVAKQTVYNFSVLDDESYVCNGVAVHNCTAPVYSSDSLHSAVVEVIVKPNARFRYTTIQNWSNNVYNLVTKRARVEKDGVMEWIDGNLGCLTGDSKVFLKAGVKNIKDIVVGDDVFTLGADLKPRLDKVTAKKNSGKQKVYKLITQNSREICATNNHPFLVLKKIGKYTYLSWKELKDISEGDLVAISGELPDLGVPYDINFTRRKGTVKNISLIKETTDDLMWFLGFYIGDGYCDKTRVYIAVPNDDPAHTKITAAIENIFGLDYEIRGVTVRVNSTNLVAFIKDLGFTGNARTKRIPMWVFELPLSQKKAFIEGYIAADGHFRKNHKNISITSVSKELLQDVKTLALTCGLDPTKISKWTRKEKKPLGKEIKEYTHYFLYFGESVFDSTLSFSKVSKIALLGIEETYDIEVESSHNFIANGFFVHNSKLTMKYPSCYLVGEGAHGEVLSIAYASKNQHQDAGAKMVHTAPNTTSTIISKSVSVNGGRSSYRGLVSVTPSAKNVKSRVECDALILDDESRSDTYPTMLINESSANIEHEATVSKIGEEKLFYLMSRGLTEIEAMSLIVSGFIEPIVKELPLEYAVELNRLIELEMEGSVG